MNQPVRQDDNETTGVTHRRQRNFKKIKPTDWKSSASFHRVRLEGVKSAEPPINSGIIGANLLMTVSDAFLDATAGSDVLYVGKAAFHPSGSLPENRRTSSAC